MKINILPIRTSYEWSDLDCQLLFVKRGNDSPYLLMREVNVKHTCSASKASRDERHIYILGNIVEGHTMTELQDDDVLILFTTAGESDLQESYIVDCHVIDDQMIASFECSPSILQIADAMSATNKVVICDKSKDSDLTTAEQISSKLANLYRYYPAYQHIMIKEDGHVTAIPLGVLASRQSLEKQKTLASLMLALPIGAYSRHQTELIRRILSLCEYEEEFSFLTQEEQISAFIEFSKQIATKKNEYVPDTLIEAIKQSPEYEQVLNKLSQNNLGVSDTQQFNVYQSTGFFSQRISGEAPIIYNLSDMGAGKTLMTVESIYLLDLKQISAWANNEDKDELINENVTICDIRVPDKHIIAPTLSVKSSWIDTFKLFYDVEETDDDFKYELTCTFGDITAHSTIYVVPFTVKSGNIHNVGRLPEAKYTPYLIIDEIHQLIKKKIAKTKFFPSYTTPTDQYNIFILSGTMSNLQVHEWFNFLNFMGITLDVMTQAQYNDNYNTLIDQYCGYINSGVKDIGKMSHRYFDAPPVTKNEYYNVTNVEKMPAREKFFYMKYGAQAVKPQTHGWSDDESREVDSLLTNCDLVVNPAETDAINFELFYKIIGSKAITAQSMQIAEELFGEQKTQHLSDVIKTVSPLSADDLQILKTLHHIAADSDKYKSLNIAKQINNGILNLNDGLQTKNLYELVAGFAEKNLRFFEYLSTLDVNVLEKLQESGLIATPKLEDTQKFKVLKDILASEPDETHLIVVNDFFALKSLSDALGIEHITKDDLKDELNYQTILDDLFEKQSIVIVTQDMIKSSLDLVQANRLIQYQLNTEISDIIQTQNRINRIGQTRETKGYYIATDQLQENLIKLFLESYRNIRVAHKGIVELFTDLTKQINVVNDYLEKAFIALENEETVSDVEETVEETVSDVEETVEETVSDVKEVQEKEILGDSDLIDENELPEGEHIDVNDEGYARALLYPQNGETLVFVPLSTGTAFLLGTLKDNIHVELTGPKEVLWDLDKNKLLGGVAA